MGRRAICWLRRRIARLPDCQTRQILDDIIRGEDIVATVMAASTSRHSPVTTRKDANLNFDSLG